jgi:hypothetical protein
VPRISTRFAAAAGTTALLSLVTACSSADRVAPAPYAASSTSPLPSTSASARSARAIADEEALKAYTGMIGAWTEAAKTSDAGAPELRKYAQDQALKALTSDLVINKTRKLVAKGAPIISPKAIDARPVETPKDVVVQDCLDTTNWLLYKASGDLANDVPGDRRQVKALVRKTDGVWKVVGFGITESSC